MSAQAALRIDEQDLPQDSAGGEPSCPAVSPVAAMHARLAEALLTTPTAPRTLPFTTDLKADIGSAPWWRGLGVLTAAIALALALGPRPAPIDAPAIALDAPAREAFADQAVMPLALGGDLGGRMGPAINAVRMAAMPDRPRITLTARFDPALGLAGVLARAGASMADAARAATLVAAAAPGLGWGTPLAVTLGARPADGGPRPLEHLGIRARLDLALDVLRRGGGLALSRTAIPVDDTPLRVRGRVGSGLYLSASAAGVPPAAIQQYLRAIDQSIGIDALHPDDTWDIVLGYARAAGGRTSAGPLLYAGLDDGGRPAARLVRWQGDFVNALAPQAAHVGLVMPVLGAHVTSGYGMRFHPILGYTRMHQGIDLGAPWGSAIRAVADGVVEWAGPHGGHGNFVRLDHAGGMGTGYAHMSSIAVSPGERVHAGEVIGYVGSTGLSTGPHLHFEVYQNGQVVDPASARFVARAGFDARDRAVLQARLRQLLLVPEGLALKPLPGR